jgi:hypothetical protein
MPLYLTYRSYINFGQPVSYGLSATRNYLFIIIGIWLIYKFKTKKLNLQIIEKAFLILAWASLVLQIFVIKFIDPMNIDTLYVSFTPIRGCRYRFCTFFIIFGTLYYFVTYAQKRKKKYIIYFSLFMAYIFVAIQGRSLILTICFVFTIYLLLFIPLKKSIL